MIQVKEIKEIRTAFFLEGLSKNEIAIKFERSWATIDKILAMPEEPEINNYKERKRKVSTEMVMNAIAEMLDEEISSHVKRKQRSTAKNIYEKLISCGVYKGSIRRMQELVNEVRSQLAPVCPNSYLPLAFPLGSAAQVDHGEAECTINGVRKTYYLFVISVPGAVLRYCQLFPTKSQEAWGEFHERAFTFFKGIFKRIIYDNDTVLISDIQSGKKRVMTLFGTHLVKHYGFEANFCNPASGNEKGSVENSVGYLRRNYLPGCPVFSNCEEANAYLERKCTETINTEVHYKTGESLTKIDDELSRKLDPMLPPKKWRRWVHRSVNSYQQISIDAHNYSVPEKFVCKHLRVGISIFTIEVFDGLTNELIVIHQRQFVPGEDSLMLDHYLDQLNKKPGALWDCKVTQALANDEDLLKAWEILMERAPALNDLQSKLRRAQTDFINILMLRRSHDEAIWRNALQKSLKLGLAEAVIIECIIRDVPLPKNIEGETIHAKLTHLDIQQWQCDLSVYANVGEEKVSC